MMLCKVFLVLSAILLFNCVEGLLLIPPPKIKISTESELEAPLLLTPLLEANHHIEAQKLAKVSPPIGNTTSYSGFFTVDETCKSNLFFWFFLAEEVNWEDAPVLLWLQGGPGSSSMFGLFEEIGPFEYSKEEGYKKRQYSWNVKNNLLFIDQPVGVGFSFTGELCYPTDETEVGDNLYSALIQFFKLFPSLQNNKFFISGESYAGHYIPALGHTIHKNNPSAKVKINLSAMMIGNGLTDPEMQMDYGSFLYQIGLIDDKARTTYKMVNEKFQQEVANENWEYAVSYWTELVGELYDEYVGDVNKYNFNKKFTVDTDWEELIQVSEMRKALHVGGGEFNRISIDVYFSLLTDIPKSVRHWVEELLEHYPVILYYGQLDIICGYSMARNFIRSISWSGQSQYLNATRSKWCVGKDQAGYLKGEHRLFEVLVRAAGHMVPSDQPQWAYELVNSITSGLPDNPLHALKSCN